MENKLLVPDIGDFEKVEIIEILVKIGDKIKKNDSIVTLESDKSSVEVPSNLEGVVESVNVKIGDKVSKDDLLITLKNVASSKETNIKTEEKIPPVTEKIIQEAENTLISKKETQSKKLDMCSWLATKWKFLDVFFFGYYIICCVTNFSHTLSELPRRNLFCIVFNG